MSVTERQRAFTLTKELFDDLVEDASIQTIRQIKSRFYKKECKRVNEKLAQE